MTRWPVRIGPHQQRIIVAVHLNTHQVEEVPAGLALRPQTLTTSAPESHLLRVEGLLVCLFVHIAEHQHVLRLSVLYYRRHQPAALLKIYLHFFLFI